jgi:hypothetical protein
MQLYQIAFWMNRYSVWTAVLNMFSMDHQRRITVGRDSLACMRSLA